MEDKNKQNSVNDDEHLEIDKLLTPEEFNELAQDTSKEKSNIYSSNIIKSKEAKIEYPKFEEYGSNEESAQLKTENNSETSSQEYLIRNFKDFLVLPKIGDKKTEGSSRVIHTKSSENQEQPGTSITQPQFQELLTGETSVIINRNNDGEIESIEVYCKDGEKVVIRFEFEDESPTQKE